MPINTGCDRCYHDKLWTCPTLHGCGCTRARVRAAMMAQQMWPTMACVDHLHDFQKAKLAPGTVPGPRYNIRIYLV